MQVSWTRSALLDLDRIRLYIAEFNPWAGNRVAVQLLAAADSLEHLPRRGRPGRLAGTRELVSVQPFVIVYRITTVVEILRIWHGAQDR
ncbi:type II toxin-antitoxin system RelE/ParE family toxin [Inquilinus limosus]|uniref:type II toxin-antitoxin system RelE/ParE family toxin n=1 Tax=Inquilinus limosus TaxID=171674 RepID=UPI0009DE6913|nr:type II toxin-antitoxin system RelE/ParE family toxin [Inquilinus limosus]